MTVLDFSSLEQAVEQLKQGLTGAEPAPDNELLRDGVIQRFEYTQELAVKFIRRTPEVEFAEAVDPFTYRDLIRTAFERGLIAAPERWFAYREARNKTSHAYDQNIAREVYAQARPFLDDALDLLHRLHAIPKRTQA